MTLKQDVGAEQRPPVGQSRVGGGSVPALTNTHRSSSISRKQWTESQPATGRRPDGVVNSRTGATLAQNAATSGSSAPSAWQWNSSFSAADGRGFVVGGDLQSDGRRVVGLRGGSSHPNLADGPKADVGRVRLGSASDILDENADLDDPRYKGGLSSPDLGQKRKTRRKATIDRWSSLDVLRRSHECLKAGPRCHCKCTIKLYRPSSAFDVSARLAATRTIVARQEEAGSRRMVLGRAENGPYGQKDNNKYISDSDVSSFFMPSPTVWEPSSIPRRGATYRQRAAFVDTTPRQERSNVSSHVTSVKKPPLENGSLKSGTLKARDRQRPTELGSRANGSLPADKPAGKALLSEDVSRRVTSSSSSSSSGAVSAPPKPPRWKPEVNVTSHNNTTSPRTTKTTTRTQITTSTASPPAYTQKPIARHQPTCVTSMLRSVTADPVISPSTPYFKPRAPGLPPGKDVSSYVYRSEEEKAKVLSLLERYASKSHDSNLGLSKEEMAAYLSCAKRQLGLDKQDSTQASDNGMQTAENKKRDIQTEVNRNQRNVQNGDLRKEPFEQVISKVSTKSMVNGVCPTNSPTPENDRPNSGYRNPDDRCQVDSGQKSRPLRDLTNRVPSIVIVETSLERPRSARKVQGTTDNRRMVAPSTDSAGKQDNDVVVLPQTTFHVDGAITDTPAVRRRLTSTRDKTWTRATDDVNNNGGVGLSRASNPSPERSTDRDRPQNGKVLSSIPIRSRRRGKKTSSTELQSAISETLLSTGISGEHYERAHRLVNESIRYSRSLDRLTWWLRGVPMLVTLTFLLLITFSAAYAVSSVPQLSAWLAFSASIVVLVFVTFIMERKRRKIKENLRRTLMDINSLLWKYYVLCSPVHDWSSPQGTAIHFVHFDVSLCQESICLSIADKACEDLLLTEISSRYPSLFESITNDLNSVSDEPEQIGTTVISRDILMYFASAFVENFLLHKKASYGDSEPNIRHKNCICDFVRSRVFGGLLGDVDSQIVSASSGARLSACRPTVL